MVRRWGDVLVEVHLFLEGLGNNLALFDGNCQIQEVHGVRWFYEGPGEYAKGVDILFELIPARVTAVSNPYPKYVINEAAE